MKIIASYNIAIGVFHIFSLFIFSTVLHRHTYTEFITPTLYAIREAEMKLLIWYCWQLELYPRRMMLYISGIPLHYTHEMYVNFLSRYGEVETAFLSRTSRGLSVYPLFTHSYVVLDWLVTTSLPNLRRVSDLNQIEYSLAGRQVEHGNLGEVL